MNEIKSQIEQLRYEKAITPDSNKYHELTKKMKELSEELENLRRQ